MTFAGSAGKLKRFCAISGASGRGHSKKLISDFGQRAYHDHWAFMQPIAHDGRDSVNGLRVLHGGAAEFHDDHESTPENIHHGDTEARRTANDERRDGVL